MTTPLLRPGLSLVALLGIACTGGGAGGESADGPPLAASLRVDPEAAAPGAPLRLWLDVTNRGSTAVSVGFTSGQRFDFVVRRDGAEVSRWSEGRMFTQVLGTEAYPPAETRTHEAELAAPSEPGEYTVVGWLTSAEVQVRDSVRLTVR